MKDFNKKEREKFNDIVKTIKDKKSYYEKGNKDNVMENCSILIQGGYGRGKTTFLEEVLEFTKIDVFGNIYEEIERCGKKIDEENIEVSIYDRNNKKEYYTEIDQEGNYKFKSLVSGSYEIRIKTSNFCIKIEDFLLRGSVRFNRTCTFENSKGEKEKLIHISPWNRDTKHDFTHYLLEEFRKGECTNQNFLGTRVILNTVYFLIVFLMFKKIMLMLFGNLKDNFKFFLIIKNSEILNFSFFINSIIIILFTLLLFIILKKILVKAEHIIYEFLVLVKNKNSTYMFDYQREKIKKILKKYNKNSSFNTIYIVAEDMDRVDKETFDEFIVIWNNLNEIICDINKNSNNPKIVPIILFDKYKVAKEYEFKSFEKIRQYEIILERLKLEDEAIEEIVKKETKNFNPKLISYKDYLFKRLASTRGYDEVKKIAAYLNEIDEMNFREYNRLVSKIKIETPPIDNMEKIISEIKSLTEEL